MKTMHFSLIIFAGIMLTTSCEKMETTVSESGSVGLKSSSVNSATIQVEPEGPMYDTENLLEAFALAESKGKGSVIQLNAGVYYLDQIDIYNFRGTLKGAGKGRTVIHTIPGGIHMPVDRPYIETTPYLFSFHGGDFTVCDISFDISDDNPVRPYDWWTGGDVTFLCAVVRVNGLSAEDYNANAVLKNLSFTGMMVNQFDYTPYNIDNCILLGFGYSVAALGGHFTIQNCDFKTAETAINSGGLSHANVTIGGSPKDGNIINSVNAGFGLFYGDHVNLKISNNKMTDIGTYGGIYLDQESVPDEFNYNVIPSPCNYLIYGNSIELTGDYPDAITICDFVGMDDPTMKSKAVVRDNFFKLTQANQTAIAGYWAYNSNFQQNIITGESNFAVLLYGNSSDWKLIFNNFDDFEPAWADILLYSGTYNNMVICETDVTSVYDASGLNIIKGPAERGKEVDISEYLAAKMKKPYVQ